MAFSFSTWEFIRAAGLTSFFLLFLSVAAGLLLALKAANATINKNLQVIHQSTGWLSLLCGFFHGLLLYIDTYQPFSLMEIFVPFTAKEDPLLNGIGTISLYVIVLLFLTGDLMKKVGAKVWKKIHRLALPGFVLISIHGIFLGTDTNEVWGMILYTSTLAIISCLLLVKLLLIKTKTKKVISL